MIIIKAMVVLSTTLFNLLQFGVLYSWLKFAFDNCITFNSKEQYVLPLINMFMKMNV